MTEEKRLHDDSEKGTTSEMPRTPKKVGGFVEFLVILAVAFVLVFGVVRPSSSKRFASL